MSAKISFIENWMIRIRDMPKYTDFEGEFIEPLDYPLLKLLHESNNPLIKPEMKTLLKNTVLDNINKSTGELKVRHNNTRYKMGRYYPNGDISIIPHSKYIKHTVLQYCGWLDIDMVKGHPTIAYEMGRQIGLNFTTIKTYIDNFDEIAKVFIEFYSKDETPLVKDDIKWLFVLMIYGGGFSTWKNGLAKDQPEKGYSPRYIKNENILHPFAQEFKIECETIATRISRQNNNLLRKMKQEGEELHEYKMRLTSYWFQTIENHVLYEAYQFLLERGIIKPKRCGLEYDGLCIPPPSIEFDKNTLIEDLNDLIVLKTGLNIRFKFKEYGDFVMHDIIEMRNGVVPPEISPEPQETQDEEENPEIIFAKLYPEFEKTHAKIINKAVFVKSHANEIIVMSKSQLITAYEHIQCGFTRSGTPVNFISRWTSFNDKIRRYDDMQIYPNPELCPPNVFNMWIPFKCELYDTPYVENIEGRDFILNHIRILCNNEGIVNDYFIKWIGQMIQYPEFKSICITLISKQGAGKGTLLKLFALMLGEKKVLETRDPARDVWGNFNGIMQNAFLVNLNELSKKDTIEAEGRIKGLITDPTLTINSKGVNQYNINSYHRFITTTNNPDPSKTSEDDRRNLIIRSSDEKIGDKEYFNKLNAYLDDVNVIRTCYDYFKSIPDLDKFGSLPIPKTEYQNNLKELARTPVEQWLEHFTREHINEEQVEMLGKETFAEFDGWRRENNITYETTPLKLGVALSNLQINGGINKGRHTSKGESKYYNIPILKKYFNIGLMIEIDDDDDDDTDIN